MDHVRNSLLLVLGISSASLLSHAANQVVELTKNGKQVDITIGEQPFTTYFFGSQVPKPYFHPLRSAQGTIVTRQYPMVKNIPGESHDHPHHRGMFFAHGNINGIDFWDEGETSKAAQVAKGKFYASENLPKGRTEFEKLGEVHSGPQSGSLRATFNLVGPDGKIIGTETQSYIFQGDESSRIVDCEFTIRAGLGGPVKMGDTKEGAFGIRVAKELEGPSGHMLNSEGATNEARIWGKRADWLDYWGTVGAEKLGIAIFDSPTNPKHPTYWHARAYGLFAVNPFGEHDFYNDKTRDGSMTIPPGGSLTLRYRVLIHHGDPEEAKVADAYKAYEGGK